MMNDEQLIEAVKSIKGYCANTEIGGLCPFGPKGVCIVDECPFVTDMTPDSWYIPKICKWTDEDISIAKGLRGSGYVSLFRDNNNILYVRDHSGNLDCIPTGLFREVKAGEAFSLDDIIE